MRIGFQCESEVIGWIEEILTVSFLLFSNVGA